MHKVQVTPVIGLPKYLGWASVAVNHSQNSVVSFAIVGTNAHNVGREVVLTIESAEVFTAADLNNLVLSLRTQARSAGGSISIAAVGLFNDRLFFATVDGSILLKRHDKVGVVLPINSEIQVKEGSFQPDDVIVLCTEVATEINGEIKQKFQQGFDVDSIVTSTVPSVHRHPQSELIALGFVTFDTSAVAFVTSEPLVSVEVQQTSTMSTNFISLETEKHPVEVLSEAQLVSEGVDLTKSPKRSLVKRLKQVVITIAHSIKNTLRIGRSHIAKVSWRELRRVVVPAVFVGGVLLLLLGGWWYVQRRQISAVEAQVQPILAEFSTIASQVESNPVEVREKLQTQRSQLIELQRQYQSQPLANRYLATALAKVDTLIQTLSGQETIAHLPLFVDLRALSSDWIGQRMDADATTAAVLDKGKQQLARLDLSNRSVTLLSGIQTATTSAIKDVAVSDQLMTIIGPGVRQISSTDPSASETTLVAEGDSNREATLVASFGPYIYVVNPSRRNIYRYTVSKEVSAPIGWLVPGEKVPFDQVVSIAVDGEVWLGTKEGNVLKMASGRVVDFSIRGLEHALSTPVVVYTKDFLQHLYVLEPAAKRVLVLRKNGDFVKEYQGDELGAATDIVASESLGQILVVSGSAVFSLPL